MRIKLNELYLLFKIAFNEWFNKDPFRESAIIAYYAIFSIPGLLLLIITVAGYFFGNEAVNQNIIAQISGTMGNDTAMQIKDMLEKAVKAKSTLFGSIVAIFILIIGATGVFVELQKTFNRIWEVKALPEKGFLRYIKARVFSFGLILAIAFLLLISLVVSTGIAAMSELIKTDASIFLGIIFTVLNFFFSLGVVSILFALMFKILPDAKIKWSHVWLGSFVTGLLFETGKTVLAFYFGKVQPASIYGTAGSIILILLWVSYSAMILFFGAELTAAYAKIHSGTTPPTDIAKKEPDIRP
ncbi:MAG: YihY/virulence factor BrkB family protein [Bacteroidota bacterium]